MQTENASTFANTTFSFALNQTFNAFMKKWPCHLDKKIMIETWTQTISNKDIQSIDIANATHYCINHLNDWPSIYKFKTYCERSAANLPLSSPVITQAEEIAQQLLKKLSEDPTFKTMTSTHVDALLIAAITAHQASQGKEFVSSPLANQTITWRFGMFIKEFPEWLKITDQDFWLTDFMTKFN